MVISCNKDFIAERTQRLSKIDAAIFQRMKAAGIPDVNMNPGRTQQQFEEMLKKNEIEEIIQLYYITKRGKIWWISSPFMELLVLRV